MEMLHAKIHKPTKTAKVINGASLIVKALRQMQNFNLKIYNIYITLHGVVLGKKPWWRRAKPICIQITKHNLIEDIMHVSDRKHMSVLMKVKPRQYNICVRQSEKQRSGKCQIPLSALVFIIFKFTSRSRMRWELNGILNNWCQTVDRWTGISFFFNWPNPQNNNARYEHCFVSRHCYIGKWNCPCTWPVPHHSTYR